MAETFSYDRASFAERAAKLAGGTTYREPIGGRSTKQDIPDEHSIAAAFVYARKMVWDDRLGEFVPDKHDISPEIAVAIATQTQAHGERIVAELAAALMAGLGYRANGHTSDIVRVAAGCYLRAVFGVGTQKPEGLTDRQYELARILGDSVLWTSANEAMFRAERAYRHEGRKRIRAIAETRLQSSPA